VSVQAPVSCIVLIRLAKSASSLFIANLADLTSGAIWF
jgi:hypothetical protein